MKKLISVFIVLLLLSGCSLFRFNDEGLSFNYEEELKDYKNCFYYNTLNDNEKKIYSCLFHASILLENTFEFRFDFDLQESTNALSAFTLDWPEYYWWNYGFTSEYIHNVATCTLNHDDFDGIVENFYKLYDKASSILKEVSYDDDYYTIKMLHNYLIDHTTYNEDIIEYDNASFEFNDNNNTFACLVNGSSVCYGYATSFRLLSRMLGYDSLVVNSIDDEKHAWNMICIDGNWYNVDVTWADMKDEEGNETITSYEYFLAPDKVFGVNHTPKEGYKYPKANDDSLYYFNMPGFIFEGDNMGELDYNILNLIRDGYNSFDIKFTNYDDCISAYDYLFTNNGFENLYSNNISIFDSYKYNCGYDENSYLLKFNYSIVD